MHPTIKDEPLAGCLDVIAVGADLSPAREIDKFQQSEDDRSGMTTAIGKLWQPSFLLMIMIVLLILGAVRVRARD
jgi:hypothetical protein